jgi:hypothetical protein
MKPLVLILLGLLAAWWGVLTLWVISCHRDRVRAAAKPMTPEELEECRRLEANMPRRHMRPKDYAVISPFLIPVMLVMMPLYLYGWLVKDPYRKHD